MTGLSGDKRKEREKLLRNFSLSFSPSAPNARPFERGKESVYSTIPASKFVEQSKKSPYVISQF